MITTSEFIEKVVKRIECLVDIYESEVKHSNDYIMNLKNGKLTYVFYDEENEKEYEVNVFYAIEHYPEMDGTKYDKSKTLNKNIEEIAMKIIEENEGLKERFNIFYES